MKWFFILSAAVYFLQGIEGLPGLAVSLWLKETIGLQAYELQRFMSYITLAWLIKPLWGYLVDFHSTKIRWVAMSIVTGIGFMVWLGLGSFGSHNLLLLIVLMAMLNWTMAVRDVANDGIACVVGKDSGTTGKFQSIQWGSLTFAGLLATLGGGWIAQNFTFQTGYLVLVPLLFVGLLILWKVPRSEGVDTRCQMHLGDYRKLLRSDFLLLCLFVWLFNTAPSFAAPLLYKQRDVFHWSAMRIAYLGVMVSVLDLIGAWIYSKYCRILPMKKILIASILFFSPTTLCYLYYTPVTAWVYAGTFATIGMVVFLVCMDFMARKSIDGLEATSFAMLCSVSNFGGWCSAQMGSYCLEWWGLTTTICINAAFGLLALGVVPFLKWEEK
jgi:hypothetical protein